MPIWIVCFKWSLDACTPFSKWVGWKTSFQHNRTVIYEHQICQKKWMLDVSFTVKTQKLVFYFCLKWGRIHTKNREMKHPTVSGARVYQNDFIMYFALERWQMSQMTKIYVCFCKACNCGTVVRRSERMVIGPRGRRCLPHHKDSRDSRVFIVTV